MPAVGAFIDTLAKYSYATIQRANTNGNGYLTKAESKNLPKDLQDNYAAHQRSHTVAGVKMFHDSFVGYAALKVKAADVNKDGWLSAAESKNLPVDLQDNYTNYMAQR